MEKTDQALFCDVCSLQFDKKIVYDIHQSFVHTTEDKVEIEEKTIQIKEENEDLAIHSNNTKSMTSLSSLDSTHKGTKSHTCSICDYSFSRKDHLMKHIESVHEGKKPHKCSICDYSASSNGNLKKHIEAVHEGKKPHKCSICDYSFSEKHHLKKHIESVHKGEKPHKCSICDYSCSQKKMFETTH